MTRAWALAVACIGVVGCNPSNGYRGHGQDGGMNGSPDLAHPQGGGDDAGACTTTDVAAASVKLPVDIIWVIDNSGSMSEEEGYVQTNMNSFASAIAASGVDYHVVVISDTGHINVPPPLGGSPQLMAINQSVDSHNAFRQILATYPQWQSFLRPSATKHIVVVSDDESDLDAASFKTMMAALTNPGFPAGFTLHAIVAESLGFTLTIPPVADHCLGKAAAVGTTYLALQVQTGGVFSSLCDTNWAPVFTALSTAVTQGLALPCNFGIPPPPAGQQLDFGQVNLVYTPTGGAASTVPQVANVGACGPAGGWYYDNPSQPTQLIACPTTCAAFTADSTGMVAVAFGCATVIQ
jgi:hypothetical protein